MNLTNPEGKRLNQAQTVLICRPDTLEPSAGSAVSVSYSSTRTLNDSKLETISHGRFRSRWRGGTMRTAARLLPRKIGLFKINLLSAILIVAGICSITATPASAQSFTSLYSFCSQAHCPDGNGPNGWLVQGLDGNLYGTTLVGGANGYGTVFRITPAGTLTTLHTFNDTDGNGPSALIRATDGNFYGTTSSGGGTNCSRGSNLCGTVFKITPAGVLTTLYDFCSQPNCTDGFFPSAALIQGLDGNLYGTTQDGGAAGQCETLGCGTIFKITLTGTLTTLYTFCPHGNCTDPSDGGNPNAPLVQGPDGTFYGTTGTGGGGSGCIFGCGTAFKLSGGTLTTLYAFNSMQGTPGQITQALDGNLYGVTTGALFKITPGGFLTIIHNFVFTDGYTPVGLLQATDNNFYGTAEQGGNNNCILGCGTIFKTNSSGTLTTLHAFSGADGSIPMGGLVQGTDGNFYGTTSKGGTSTNCQGGCGTVFKLGTGLTPFVETQPSVGTFGSQVNILGSNLTGATGVSFNGTAAPFKVVSPSQILASVPTGGTTGTVQVTLPGTGLSSSGDFQIVAPLQLIPVSTCRVVDTRPTHNPILGGTSQNFVLPQLGNCGIPANAAAYSLNVTVVPNGPLGYLTVWPAGEIQPYTSTMNSTDGRIKANAVIVPSGNNAISVFSH
jgi:uncharacterized repeat protein (TIGR03803 family)